MTPVKIHNSYKNKELELEWSAKYILKIVCTRSAAVCFPRPFANNNLPSIELNANLVTDDKQWGEIISSFLNKLFLIRFHKVWPNPFHFFSVSTQFWAQFSGSNPQGPKSYWVGSGSFGRTSFTWDSNLIIKDKYYRNTVS